MAVNTREPSFEDLLIERDRLRKRKLERFIAGKPIVYTSEALAAVERAITHFNKPAYMNRRSPK